MKCESDVKFVGSGTRVVAYLKIVTSTVDCGKVVDSSFNLCRCGFYGAFLVHGMWYRDIVET
jgi:hypothetical protein